jgi:hypothetical protein
MASDTCTETTGDNDNESVIWHSKDNFSTVKPVISEGQKSRAVALLFSEQGIFYGTDSPDCKNTIRAFDRRGGKTRSLARTEGPVFFATRAGNRAFFSTAVEPSTVNRSKDVVIYASDNFEDWVEALRIKKDWLPPKLFQYGQARFAAGPNDGKSVWVSPLGTEHDQRSLKLKWSD